MTLLQAQTLRPRRSLGQALIALINQPGFQLGTLLLWALLMNREGVRVPNANEFTYLLYFYKAWHAQFLATDWTFQETTAGHGIFNLALGWITLLMPLESAAWLGRALVWTGAFIGLMRVGRHFQIASWVVWIGILLWLAQRQAPVTVEWIIGTFEAKCIAYICLLFGIDAALRNKNLLAGVLCGLAFTFHTAVGMWGGAALGVAVLLHNPIRETIKFALAVVVFCLPGLISSIPLLFGHHAISAEEAKYIVTTFEPQCLDPLSFPKLWLILMPLLMLFGACYSYWLRAERTARLLFWFELSLASFFLFGVIARLAGRFDLVQLFPLRVFSVFVLLFFYWQMGRIVVDACRRQRRPGANRPPAVVIGFAIVLLLVVPNPLLQFGRMAGTHLHRYQEITTNQLSPNRSEDADFRKAAVWVEANTPQQDVVIAPPWLGDAFYYTRRPLIANWHFPRYDAMTEWRSRIESLVGDVINDPDGPGEIGALSRQRYAKMTTDHVLTLGQKYQAKWLVTSGKYPFEQVYESGNYSVYRLP